MDEKAKECLDELYRGMFTNLLLIADSKLRDYHLSEDVVQDTFVAAEKHIEKLMSSPNPAGWLCNALKYKIKHEVRSIKRFRMLQEKLEQERLTMGTSYSESLYSVEEIISEDDYSLLSNIYIDGYAIKEVANMLGISYETCKKRVQRAKEKIRKHFG